MVPSIYHTLLSFPVIKVEEAWSSLLPDLEGIDTNAEVITNAQLDKETAGAVGGLPPADGTDFEESAPSYGYGGDESNANSGAGPYEEALM
jgi:hypothetical protein